MTTYNLIIAFVKANILIVTIYILSTAGEAQQFYLLILSLCGLTWILNPFYKQFKKCQEQKKEK